MSSTLSHGDAPILGGRSQDLDDAEKGLYDNTQSLTVLPLAHIDQKTPIHIDSLLSPISPIHEGITPFSSVTRLSLAWPTGWKTPTPTVPDPEVNKPERPKQKISQWILFLLWFNTYRKFFTFVTLLNLAGIIMAALDRFPYAENHLGALVLGNLLCAVLMRNELFLRFLYTISIYGLRSVCPISFIIHTTDTNGGFVSGLHYVSNWQLLQCYSTLEASIRDAHSPALGKTSL
jgi:hypothetical protein